MPQSKGTAMQGTVYLDSNLGKQWTVGTHINLTKFPVKVFFERLFIYLFIYLFNVCVYTVAVIRQHQKGTSDPITDVVSHHVGCWDLNSGPLEGQSVFLTAEPSLQPQSRYFNWHVFPSSKLTVGCNRFSSLCPLQSKFKRGIIIFYLLIFSLKISFPSAVLRIPFKS